MNGKGGQAPPSGTLVSGGPGSLWSVLSAGRDR